MRRFIESGQIVLAATAFFAAAAAPASAYDLFKETSCDPGQKWDTSRPVEVRFLGESFKDYALQKGWSDWPSRMLEALDDVKAVIEVYNAVPGSDLTLEYAGGYSWGSSIKEPQDQEFDEQTIVIGFTDETHKSSPGAEAWAPGDPEDGCTRTRAHILFRKDIEWTFGPPDADVEDGRHFGPGTAPHTFLGILTHEMGHAVGLGHPEDDYALMTQGFKTWIRGRDHVMRTQLLPDDMAGVLALYGTSNIRTYLDISVSNTWYESAEERRQCDAEERALAAAEDERNHWQTIVDAIQGVGGDAAKSELQKAADAAALAGAALDTCEDKYNAKQRENCTVSSRTDTWADRADGAVLCGVNNASNSAYPQASAQICPRGQVQLRYTLNNHGAFRDASVKTEVWFSKNRKLDVRRGRELQSPNVRETFVRAGSSATVGQVFQLPTEAVEGEDYWVFVRAIPHDPDAGNSLWTSDVDRWNNAILIRDKIEVTSTAC